MWCDDVVTNNLQLHEIAIAGKNGVSSHSTSAGAADKTTQQCAGWTGTMKADSKPEVVGGLQLTSVADLVAEGDDAPILNGGNAGGAGVDPLDSAGRRYVRKQRTAAVAAIITLVLVCVGVAVAIFISNRPSSGVPIPEVRLAAFS